MKVFRRKKVLPIKKPIWDVSEDEYDTVIKLFFDAIRNLLICSGVFVAANYVGDVHKFPDGTFLKVYLNVFGLLLLAALVCQWFGKVRLKKFRTTCSFLVASFIFIFIFNAFLLMFLLFLKQKS